MSLPSVMIVMTTYFPEGELGERRFRAAIQTFDSWQKHLLYDSDNVHVLIADDGSPNGQNFAFRWFRGYLVAGTKQQRKGVGASLNAGFKRTYELMGPDAIILYAVDDWALTQDFDITPWIELLVKDESVGMVRLGPPHPGTSGKVRMFTENWQGWGLELDRVGFAFGHRPALYHKRMVDYYGWFEENCNALECERLYNDEFVQKFLGPDIVLALPHPWQHIDTQSLSAMEPGGNHE